MDYRIEAETKHRIRIRIGIRKLSEEQAKILKYAFSHAPGVSEVTVYKASAGCAIAYTGDRSEIIRRLKKLDPELKRKLRIRILGETIADTVLPLPVQLAYHAYQMVTLKEL